MSNVATLRTHCAVHSGFFTVLCHDTRNCKPNDNRSKPERYRKRNSRDFGKELADFVDDEIIRTVCRGEKFLVALRARRRASLVVQKIARFFGARKFQNARREIFFIIHRRRQLRAVFAANILDFQMFWQHIVQLERYI